MGETRIAVDVLMKLIQLMTLSRSVYQIIFSDSRARYNFQLSSTKHISQNGNSYLRRSKKQLSNQTVQ